MREPGFERRRYSRRAMAILAFSALIGGHPLPAAGFNALSPIASPALAGPARACARIIPGIEQAAGIPRHLLAAIALAESGRAGSQDRAMVAWPWTINAEGEGRFFATKAEAVAAVAQLQARGVASIDIGCMQVNLYHHPDAFASLDEAFDPAANVAYAAQFLKSLRQDKGSWPQAVAFYHSATRTLNVPYRGKVYRLWAEVRRSEAEKKRQQVIAAYLARRAAQQATAGAAPPANLAERSALDPPS